MASHPKQQPPTIAVPSELAFYFPHVDYGQSILVRVPPNRWIVVDANQARGGRPNGTLELLRKPAEAADFEIIALVVTHFHRDHAGGIPAVLEFCRGLARSRSCRLANIIKVLTLPRIYDEFYRFLKKEIEEEEKKRPAVKAAHLRALFDGLEELEQEGVKIGTLESFQFAWKSQPEKAGLEPDESWIFTFHPPPAEVYRRFLEGRAPDETLPSSAEMDDILHREANRYSYVLGVGHGRGATDLHVLLTADLPGTDFTRLTGDLRDRLVPDAAKGQFGAPFSLNALHRHEPTGGASPPRLRPVQCLTVPHHGSGTDPARAEDLNWWLEETRGPDRPAFAVVQGGPYSLRDNTLDELFKARLDIFATVEPLRIEGLLSGHIRCKDLDGRLLAPAEPVRQPNVRSVDSMKNDPALPPAHLRVHGGNGGIHRVFAQNLYKIVPAPLRIEHYPVKVVYEAAGMGPS